MSERRVSWTARAGDLELRCITTARGTVYYQLERTGSEVTRRICLSLTAAEFHDLMYAGRHARRLVPSPSM